MSKKAKELKFNNKHGLPRSISPEVKQLVRKRCGFGCVICGNAIYQYELFEPEFKDAKTHNPDGITLLCPNHHQNKTSGRLSVATIKRFDANPKSLQAGFVNDFFDLTGKNPVIKIGSLAFKETLTLIQFEDEPIFELGVSDKEEQSILLSAIIRDSNGELILNIDKNEWQTSTQNWDCKVEGKRIVIRSAPRKIELVIRMEPPEILVFERISMYHNGFFLAGKENEQIKFVLPDGSTHTAECMEIDGARIGIHLKKSGLSIGLFARSISINNGRFNI